jgi:hypothetical protein
MEEYQRQFGPLLDARRIATLFSRADLNRACLLCSEASADHCHRSLVAACLQRHFRETEVRHL